MKKITLPLLLFCANGLNGMEPESSVAEAMADRQDYMEALSPEVKVMIIQALNTYDNNLTLEKNVENVLKNIKAMSLTNSEFNEVVHSMYHNNQKGFKTLVHMIAKKFNMQDGKAKMHPCDIAKKFKTPAAEKYSELCEKLRSTLKKAQANITKMQEVTKLLEEGADINGFPVLLAVVAGGSVPSAELITFLLNSGANPHATNYRGVTALRLFSDIHKSASDYDKIKKLLEEAMKNLNQ